MPCIASDFKRELRPPFRFPITSEMCIRDRLCAGEVVRLAEQAGYRPYVRGAAVKPGDKVYLCLLYTSYNFPQGRVTDHRIGLTLYRIDAVLDGELDELIDALVTADQAEKLKNGGETA